MQKMEYLQCQQLSKGKNIILILCSEKLSSYCHLVKTKVLVCRLLAINLDLLLIGNVGSRERLLLFKSGSKSFCLQVEVFLFQALQVVLSRSVG